MPQASVIVPARDAARTLPRTLAALAQQELGGEFEVIVVDDGSRDATAEVATADPRTVVLRQSALGPAAARNLGASRAQGQVLAFLDADVYPTPGWLQAGLQALGHADLVQGKVVPEPGVRLGPFDRSLWITHQVGLFETANLFTTRDWFERAGGFEQWLDVRAGKALAEDVWFAYRALRSGARPAFCAAALAHHAVFPRTWLEYVRERRRVSYFPAMAHHIPELRDRFLYRRWFLTRRTAQFDLALAGLALGAVRRSALPLVLAGPYLHEVRRHSMRVRPQPPRAIAVAAADAAADLVGLASLLEGTVRYRSPVL